MKIYEMKEINGHSKDRYTTNPLKEMKPKREGQLIT
jgi:hypothetical protein